MKHHQFRFEFENTDFFGQYWEAENTKAVIVLVHGMGSHSSRYENFIVPKLVEQNYSVVTFDHFGHGRTKGKRGYTPSVEAVLGSVSYVIEKAKSLFHEKSVFLYGHSMGGNVVINHALRKDSGLTGVIATSPYLRLAFTPPAWKLKLAKFMGKIYPKFTLTNELDASKISRIPEEVEKYTSDNLVHSKVGLVFSVGFIETGQWAIDNANKLKIPMLIAHGTADGLTSFDASKEFTEKTELAELKAYQGGYHELQNDLCRDEFIKDIITWLNDH